MCKQKKTQEGVSKLMKQEKRLIVGAAGIPARSIAAGYSANYGSLQWCGQECPHLLQLAISHLLVLIHHPAPYRDV